MKQKGMEPMRTRWTRTLGLGALLCLLLVTAAGAATGEPDLRYIASVTASGNTTISLQQVDQVNYLFLPATADLKALALEFDGGSFVAAGSLGRAEVKSGVPFSVVDLAARNKSGYYSLTLTRGGETTAIRVMVSENLRSMYLTSADPAKGRSWVDSSKDNKAKNGDMVLLGADGAVIYDGTLKNIKSRGNSTWDYPKKPYQIKLSQKADLLETGEPGEAQTTWILLANYIDSTLIRNQLTYAMATEFGVPYTPHTAQVDLYYDGEYRGTYQLSEKTEVGNGRLEIHDLEADIEAANPDVEDFDALERMAAARSNTRIYQYVAGVELPEKAAGGYLLELDYKDRAMAEASWFSSLRGTYVTVKSPEYLPAAAVDYVAELYQHFEDAVYNGGIDPASGRHYTEFIDLDSLARCYLILELSGDTDAFSSSTFFYKPDGEYKLYAGPLWDFDIGYGLYSDPNSSVLSDVYLVKSLLEIPSFRNRVAQLYQGELFPLVRDVILSSSVTTHSKSLRSIRGYEADVAASKAMDTALWSTSLSGFDFPRVDDVYGYLSTHSQWLFRQFTASGWTGPEEEIPVMSPLEDPGVRPDTVAQQSKANSVTRAMMATLLYRLAGSPTVTSGLHFSDVAANASYTDAVAWAVEMGVFQGYGGAETGQFRPDDPVTRAQAVTILGRISKAVPMETNVFADVARGSWYSGYVNWAAESGIVQGDGRGHFYPRDTITPEQLALIMGRLSAWVLANSAG